jgi:hypothetical protein
VLKGKTSWVPVAHTCNPSYSGGRDLEDCGSKPARKIVCKTLSQKNPTQKRAGVAQGVGPEFKPQYQKKKKKTQKTLSNWGYVQGKYFQRSNYYSEN